METDANGQPLGTHDRTPYGQVTLGADSGGAGFTGHYSDPEIGLIYMQARFFDPATGRFVSVDPTRASPGDPFAVSAYAYANNNPYRYLDPDGKYACGSSAAAAFAPFNPGVSRSDLAAAFGGAAVSHEGQHQLDYVTPGRGYPTGRRSERATEVRAYRTEIGVPKGLGYSTDTYAPGATPTALESRVQENADASTNAFCRQNGC